MKKLMSLVLVLALALLVTACGQKTPAETEKTPVATEKTPEATKPAPTEPVETPEPTVPFEGEIEYSTELKPGVPVVTFCTWSFGTMEEMNMTRRLVYKFNAERDDVQIQIVEPEGDYDTFLTTMASARQLPDVFMVNSVPKAVINYLAKDITSLTTDDAEWNTIDKALVESVTYSDRIYGIPAGQYYMGFFANYKLIEQFLGDDYYADEAFAPGAFSTEQFIAMVKAMRNINVTDGSGTIGLDSTGDMINWLPSTLDTTGNVKHFVWNSTTRKFDFRSEVMHAALNIISDLGSKTGLFTFENVAGSGEGAAEAAFGTGSSSEAFLAGKLGFMASGTWSAFSDSSSLDVEFIGYPGGRVVSASDYMCISRATKNAELAYEVAKYLTFGVYGYESRFAIAEEERTKDPKTTITITGLPVVNNAEIADKWFDFIALDGVEEVYNLVSSGEMVLIVEGNKSVPGFQDARFLATTGLSYENVRGGEVLTIGNFIWDVCSGSIAVDQYISDMSEGLAAQLNKNVSDAYEQIAAVAAKG